MKANSDQFWEVCATVVLVLFMLAIVGVILVSDAKRRGEMSAVGGREAYLEQRIKHLERLRDNRHVTNPFVKAVEASEIDSQIEAVKFGEPAVEVGEELKIVNPEKAKGD